MKIINFKKHEKEKRVGFKHSKLEIATFDLEFPSLECILTWGGWSIRKMKNGSLVLQAPLKCRASSESREPIVKIDKIPAPLFLKLLRSWIKEDYGIEVPDPPLSKSADTPSK